MACESINCALNLEVFLYALIGGILPALLWLWFWLNEENDHHEPRSLIILTFLVGMGSVFLVFLLQKLSNRLGLTFGLEEAGIVAVMIGAFWEELAKYLSAKFVALKSVFYIHPIDAFIYMTTASLGFSAMENTFYILQPLMEGKKLEVINAVALRFMGASLLHFLTSGIIAIFIGLAFYSSKMKKWVSLCAGFVIAVLLHSFFNFFIMNNDNRNTFTVFLSVWVLVVLLTISLERVKSIKNF